MRQYYGMYTPKSAISSQISGENPASTGIELIFGQNPFIFKVCIVFLLYDLNDRFYADFCVDTSIITV